MGYDSFRNHLNLAAEKVHENADRHGFYQDIERLLDYLIRNDMPQYAETAKRDFILAQLSKIASEVGEAVSCIQHSRDMTGLPEELADIIIRTMDLSNWLGYEIGTNTEMKMLKNSTRPYKHGKTC